MFRNIEDLPEVPDLAYCLLPARLIPEMVESCGKLGIKRLAIPSGGFDEFGDEGRDLAEQTLAKAREYGVRFVGPNGLTIANTANGLCLPFFPMRRPPRGGISVISQSGGVALTIENLFKDENLGMAKFASIGNKLDLDEVDFLEYFGQDPETKIILLYLESIARGRDLISVAERIDKPIVIYKSNNTSAGKRAAMSHTAAVSNDEDIMDAAFERAGIIRIKDFHDFYAVCKAFELPPMRGNRIMIMSPAGGFSVMAADLCEKAGFSFADPGRAFYESLESFSNAGVIKFSNPLDMGDIYDPSFTAHVISAVMHSDQVDGALFLTFRPELPHGNDVFHRMFQTDLSNETWGSILSSGKPLGISMIGPGKVMSHLKKRTNFPLFDSPEELVRAMKAQMDFYNRERIPLDSLRHPDGISTQLARDWLEGRSGDYGEDGFALLETFDIPVAESRKAVSIEEALDLAESIGYPVVLKVVSPDALHKTEAGGVKVGIDDAAALRGAYNEIKESLAEYKEGARFDGVRVQQMAPAGFDMFVGAKHDDSFGPVVFIGLGGIYIEVFKDVTCALCPASPRGIRRKIEGLKAYAILKGSRGQQAGDIDALVDLVVRVSHLMALNPRIRELDINPVRVYAEGVQALDVRLRLD